MPFLNSLKLISKYKEVLIALLISIATYTVFFGNFFLSNYYFWGSDAQIEYIPARVYFYEKIVNEHAFPFWTEKMFLGFPIYADSENGYLNPINVLSILLFGPHLSYKILHFGFYLIGSLSIYFLIKRFQPGYVGYAAANLIYYFNTFMIDHQIHFNIILSIYLLPTALLLVNYYLDSPKIRFIFLESLIISFSVLYGHIQTAFIICFGVGLYYLVLTGKKVFNKSTISFISLLLLLVLIQIMPQVLPSRELFNQSFRGIHLDLYQGSYLPQMVSFLFLPYMFGESSNYIGQEINSSYTYTETYTYIGLSVCIIYIFSLLFSKFTKLTFYSYSLLWVFLIMSTLKFNGFFTTETPIIGLFRYWERSFILLSIGIALSVGLFINNLNSISFKNFWLKINLIIFPIIFIYFLINKVPSSLVSLGKVNNILSISSIYINKNFSIIFSILVLTLTAIILILANKYLKNNFLSKYLNLFLIIIFFFDLYVFSTDVTSYRLKDISSYKLPEFHNSPEKERAAYFKYDIRGMEYLYFKSWSPIGYSQFIESDYIQYMLERNFSSVIGSLRKVPTYDNLKRLGITNVYYLNDLDQDEFYSISYDNLDLLTRTSSPAKYIKKEEGYISFEIDSLEGENLHTLIKFSPSWVVKINGKEIVTDRKDIFLKFYVPQGKSTIEMQYVPESFYKGLVASLILIIIFIPLVWAFRRFKFLE